MAAQRRRTRSRHCTVFASPLTLARAPPQAERPETVTPLAAVWLPALVVLTQDGAYEGVAAECGAHDTQAALAHGAAPGAPCATCRDSTQARGGAR